MAFRPLVSSLRPTRAASLGSLLWVGAAGALAACGDDSEAHSVVATDDPDGGSAEQDGSTPSDPVDASSPNDAGQSGPDGETNTGGDPDSGVSDPEDGGCQGSGCTVVDQRAPWELRCDNLPTNTRCQGGPREVLLVVEDTGWIVMLDPEDGHFLGYFKRPSSDYTLLGKGEYMQATQGPDQCIWTVSEDNDLQVERWDTDGSYLDKPLEPHTIEVTNEAPQPAIEDPTSLAFTADRVYVASGYGYPEARLTRWTLDGTFDGVALDDGTEPNYFEVMGDGALLVSDSTTGELRRFPAGGGTPEKVSSVDVYGPAQFDYLSEGNVVLADASLGEPLNVFNLDTGTAETVYPYPRSFNNIYGVKQLGNGKWLISGGEYYFSSLDPNSVNPKGQFEELYTDSAMDSVTFRYVGRACLSEEFVSSRIAKPAITACTVPAGSAILEENFDSGAFSGSGASQAYKDFRAVGNTSTTISIETPEGASSPALKISGGSTDSLSGLRLRFQAAVKPSYVGYRLRTLYDLDYDDARLNGIGHVTLTNSAVVASEGGAARALDAYVVDDTLVDRNSSGSTENQLRGAWAHVEMRNIDWDTRSFDLYVDCVRIVANAAIPAGYGDDVDTLDLFNYVYTPTPNAVAWYDDIVIK